MHSAEFIDRAMKTFGFSIGSQIQSFLNDPRIIEINLNTDGRLWIDMYEVGRKYSGYDLSSERAKQIIYQTAHLTEKVCNEKTPFLSCELPGDGSRFQGILPPATPYPIFTIRKHASKHMTLQDYVDAGIMTPAQMLRIKEGVVNKENIIASGGTQTGKTTLLNAILNDIAATNDRLAILQEVPELKCQAEDIFYLNTADNVATMNDLLHVTLRMTPRRIIVGEVRGDEALDLLEAWNTGHKGGCCSIHANTAFSVLLRLEQLVSRVSKSPQQYTIGEAVDLIVHMELYGAKRRIKEIIEVKGYDHGRYLTNVVA